jgi:hypothetical protein
MSKSENRNKGNKRRQGNVTVTKVSNHKIENLVNSEENESLVAEV